VPIKVVSFSYKVGKPKLEPEQLIIDARVFCNPYRHFHLRNKTGLDPEVQQYIAADSGFSQNLNNCFAKAGKVKGVVYVGCVGGKHRSVFIASLIGQKFGVPVEHMEL
jgi:UPF0042 nucleotide-binding protein